MNNEELNVKILELFSKFNELAEEVKDLRDYVKSDDFTRDMDRRLADRMKDRL